MGEEIDILLRIGGKFYEGKLRPQQVGRHVSLPSESKQPIFPEPYGDMLIITDQGDSWQVKPKRFLGTEDFAEIARIVKQYGGRYVSAGKSSHFNIPKR